MQPEPLARQQVDHVDVGPLDQRRQPLAGRAADLGRLDLGPAKDLIVDRRDPEPVLQPCQRRLVPGLPEPAQSDHPDPEPNVLRPDQARLLAIRSVALREACSSPPCCQKVNSLPHLELPKTRRTRAVRADFPRYRWHRSG